MRFWDTSAVVPLLVDEPESERLRRLAADDPAIVVWWATRSECVSGIARLRRERKIDAEAEKKTRRRLRLLAAAWTEVTPGSRLREQAERLVSLHPLRAADAFQLAAALVWTRGRVSGRGFVCLDGRLCDAAEREGFDVLP